MPRTSKPPKGKKQPQPQPRQRKRAKGVNWKSGAVINPDRPLGQAVPGRPWRDGLVLLERRRRGGAQESGGVECFHAALELNARAVCAYAEVARYEKLPPDVEAELRQLPEACEAKFERAIVILTNLKSGTAYDAVVADRVARDVVARCLPAELARLLRVRRALEKGLNDATLAHEQEARFVKDNVGDNCRPGQAVLLRTFLGPSLRLSPEASAREINAALSKRMAFRPSSNVTVDALALIAFHAQINAAGIYADYLYLRDLLDLAIYAGAHTVGFSDPLDDADAATYRRMLCEGGEDLETDPHLRRERADLAAALRTVWRQIPGLAEATRRYGELPKP